MKKHAPTGGNWWQRLASQGITPEQFVFQFLIVAISVWLAIVVGDHTNRVDEHERADRVLVSVLHELGEDHVEMLQVLSIQAANQRMVERFMEATSQPGPLDTTAVSNLFRTWFNTTFFPRRAAYNILQTSGQLQYISDEGLRVRLAELYDHDYVRLYEDGKLLDSITQPFRIALTDYWAPVSHHRTPVPNADVLAVSRAERFTTNSAYYQTLLKHDADQVQMLISQIERYLR